MKRVAEKVKIVSRWVVKKKEKSKKTGKRERKKNLPDRESNPGLPRLKLIN